MPKFKKFIKKKTEKQLIIEFILRFENYALKKERLKKRFSFVLTGGLSPINLYKSLSKAKINWKNIDLFWGDERFVSQNSNNSNYKLVKRYLLKKINIKKKNIYFINTKKRNVAMSALDYQNQIKKYFKKKKISFDLILLGMGLDGHVASIFPNNLNKSNICSPVIRKDFKRITLNLKIINKSKMIILWLNTRKSSLIYKNFNNQKKIPVNYLNEKKLSIYSL